MLGELCAEIRNYFVTPDDIHLGNFSIVNGELADVDFLAEGQYFRIVGSVFNDDVYQYPATDLNDETFEGAIWAMNVPADVVQLAEDIKTWKDKYMQVDSEAMSPYLSESFGGYSYSKGTSYGGASSGIDWILAFGNRLNRYRKARVL